MSAPTTHSPVPAAARADSPVQYHPEDGAFLRPKCEANGDLTPLLIHHIRNRPVDSEPCEQQGRGILKIRIPPLACQGSEQVLDCQL